MIAADDNTIQNQRNLRRLVMSVQASYGKLNLLIAICDNWKYRDELIRDYEAELTAKGVCCVHVRIDRSQPSLKQSLQTSIEQVTELKSSHRSALVTILGADELLGVRLNEPKSAQERFFFSLQWTREALREFQFPIVIWLTPAIATALAQQAPDFWSWRGGVFEFSQPIAWAFRPERSLEMSPTQIEGDIDEEDKQPQEQTDPIALQQQIDLLLAQDPDSPLLASLYNSLGDAHKERIQYSDAEVAYLQALKLRKQQLGDRHPDVATSLNNLAELYNSQGRYAEAEPLYKQALLLTQELLGDYHLDVASSLNNLATVYRLQGKYEESEPLFLRSLEIDKNACL